MPNPAPSAGEIAFALAQDHCPPQCRAYHGTRMLMRELGLTSEPADQHAFFANALGVALPQGGTLVVSGTSDTGMPELAATLTRGRAGRIIVLDLCATPLRLVEAVLGAAFPSLETVQSDIRDYDAPGVADVVLSHSFFGQIAPEDRAAVIARWFSLLRPGGVAITVNRIRPMGQERAFAPEDGTRLANRVLARYADLRPVGQIAPAMLGNAIESYAEARKSHPVTSLAAFTDLFVAAGFEVVAADLVIEPRRNGAIAGPSMANGGQYCHLIVRRPLV